MAVAELTPSVVITRKSRSLYAEAMIRLAKNKVAFGSIIFILFLVIGAILAPVITMGDPTKQDLLANNAGAVWMQSVPFSWFLPENAAGYYQFLEEYPLGADDLGRDLWTRTVYGARVSLQVAFVASMVSMIVGVVYGLISGYMGGMVDSLMMRFVDFLYGFPALILIILMQTYFKALGRREAGTGLAQMMIDINRGMGGLFFLFIAIGLLNWIGMARVTRGQVLSIREKEYVEAAKSIGSPSLKIIFRHVLPNVLGPLIVFETLAIPGYIFTEAFLSFIGLGVDPPTPSWGIMIAEAGKAIRSYPHELFPPAFALTLTTLAFNFMGDGLRDAFDPRLKE